VIRAALPQDSRLVSELILQSDCGMLPAMFGPAVGSLLSWLQERPANPYSASNILVLAEAQNVVRAMVGSLRVDLRRADIPTAILLLAWYGPGAIARYPRLARAGSGLRGLKDDDFYLSHIAILASRRGRGEGRELLVAAEQRARSLGARRVVLDVAMENDGARAFYAATGFRNESPVRIDLGRHGAFAFLRLARDL
jgi:ribosomal protein S18 acetylase RimI-like enzyme